MVAKQPDRGSGTGLGPPVPKSCCFFLQSDRLQAPLFVYECVCVSVSVFVSVLAFTLAQENQEVS